MISAPKPLLQVDSISKRFPGVTALDGVSLQLFPGEVLAVIGENGAGKSTLMKILAGIQPPDGGGILLDGEHIEIPTVHQAQQLGIALIHQELNLCDNLDVAANIFLGREPKRCGLIDRDAITTQARHVLKSIGLSVTPDTLAGSLTIGQQQMVEIAKAVSTDARIIIMDEPTSSLTQHESERLFEIIKQLSSSGVSIIYISHRLAEVKALADRVEVLRDGKNSGQLQKDEITQAAMVERMVGRSLSSFYVSDPQPPGEVILDVRRLRTYAYPETEVSFSMRSGEIVGIAGLVGSGRTEVLTTLFGVTPPIGGEIWLHGERLELSRPRDSIARGIALVPEDRKRHGVILEMTLCENISLPTVNRHSKYGWIDRAKESRLASQTQSQLGIRTPSIEQLMKFLSGGNQQKAVVGKWLATSPRLLLLDEPTRGVDVGAKQEIYKLMSDLARNGVSLLFVSSDMEEVLGVADRLLVMHEGILTGGLSRNEFSEQAVMNLATGNLS